MPTIEELQGIVSGLTAVVKQQAEAQKATNAQIAQLTEALIAHGGGPPAAGPATSTSNTSLRMPALQLPQFRYDHSSHDDINEFVETFDVQTAHLPVETKLALLQQSCIGEWPNSVLSMEKSKFTEETTAQQKLDSLKQALKTSFAEPPEVQRRRLASEFSTMKQRATESIDCFAYRFKNNLHRLSKLGEAVETNSPQFIMSQFISKTKTDIQKHLVLKAEEYKDLSEIIEAAKRIERSFSPGGSHSGTNKPPQDPLSALNTTPTPPVPNERRRKPFCYNCRSPGHFKSSCPDKTVKTPPPGNSQRGNEVCRLWNKHQQSPCTLQNQSCKYGRAHKCTVCSKLGCKALVHNNVPPPVANACDLQAPQGPHPEPRISTTPPTPAAHSRPTPPLFMMPTLPTSSSELSVNLNRTILSCQVTSAGTQLQLPLDSCCSVTLCSLDHAQHIHSARPELNYKKLEKPIPVQMADTSASLTAVAVQEVPITWLPNKETIHVALVVPNMSWPLLFGENHLAATQALSDHSNKTVTFRHPAMNFTVSCDNATTSTNPQAAVTCLLTGKPSAHPAPTRTTVYRGLNLVTVYLTLSVASMGLLGNDLWLSGHELEPGVKVLDGLFSASEAQSILDFPSATDTLDRDLPDFQASRAMNVLVHCTKKKASIGQSSFGYLSPCSAQSKTDFDNALTHTADALCSSLDTFDSLFCHSDDTPPPLVETSTPNSLRVPMQPHCPKQASQEMFKAGLTQSSRLLHPFSQPDESDDRDLPPQSTFTLDPFSEEYHAKLRHELRLDSDEYSHVDPAVLDQFDTLLRTYPHAFLLPGAPLRLTKSDGFPLPQVIDILDWLGGGKAFAKLDLANGYWQVPVREEDREKTAVVTHCGLFEFISMPFGLKTAGATFQRLMQATFSDFLMGNVTGSSDKQHGFCMPYVDDLIVRSMSHVDALEHYRRIFERATKVGMQFKPSKCTFFSTHLEVLGHVVTLDGRIPDPKKIQAITNFPMVNSQSAVQKFLGMVGFYRHHIPRFAQRTYHLRQLLQKNKKFHLTAQVEAEFKDLIAAITGPDVLLHYPDWSKPFHVHTDASKLGVGAVLMQEDDQNHLRPLQYASQAFSPTQQRWDTREQELYAVKWAVEQWRPYLLGRKFVIETDHANLKWLCSIAPHKAKLARWASLLAEYDFELCHRPGHTNVVPDALSRNPVSQQPQQEDDCVSTAFIDTLPPLAVSVYLASALGLAPYQHVTLSPTILANLKLALTLATADTNNTSPTTMAGTSTSSQSDEPFVHLGSNRQELGNLQLQDPTLKDIHKYLSADSNKSALRHLSARDQTRILNLARHCVILDGLVMYSDEFLDDPGHFRIFVPNNKDLKTKLLRAYHDSPIGMHRGRDATYHALAQDFYWRGMGKATKRWVARCLECLKHKSANQQHGLMHPRFYDKPMNVLGIDFVGPFPKSTNGNRYILTAVCPFSHFLVAIPTPDRSATTAARALFDNVFLKLDFPSTLLSDRGGEFLNAVLRKVSNLLSIKQVFTSSYRPRANGSTERVHRFLNSALAIFASKWQKQWENYLQPAVYSHNTSTIDGTDGVTPFFLMFGRNATSPETVALQLPNQPIDKNDYAKYLVQRITEAHKLFCSIKKDLRRRQRDYYDLSANPREFTVGQEVLVRKPPPSNVEKGSATKLIRRYAGPYIITKRLKNSDLYRLRHSVTNEELPPTNVEKLIPIPEAEPNDLRESSTESVPRPAQNQDKERQYKPGQFLMYLSKSNEQADEGISLELARYLEPIGKAPVSEACKHLYFVFPASRQLLVKLGRMRGLTAHCPYLSLEGDPSGGAYNLVLDKAAYERFNARQGLLVGEIAETDEVRDSVVVHTYAPTGRRTRLAKSRVWKPVYNHDLSKKSVSMDKNKRLIDYSPDFERIEFKQIVTVRDSLEELLSVRDMDEAVVHLFVDLKL
ncbi:hypothetical protein ACROYT_G006890 [Oculina patagonica]